jgi:uncharacterized ParB-like nuclease family protein
MYLVSDAFVGCFRDDAVNRMGRDDVKEPRGEPFLERVAMLVFTRSGRELHYIV